MVSHQNQSVEACPARRGRPHPCPPCPLPRSRPTNPRAQAHSATTASPPPPPFPYSAQSPTSAHPPTATCSRRRDPRPCTALPRATSLRRNPVGARRKTTAARTVWGRETGQRRGGRRGRAGARAGRVPGLREGARMRRGRAQGDLARAGAGRARPNNSPRDSEAK